MNSGRCGELLYPPPRYGLVSSLARERLFLAWQGHGHKHVMSVTVTNAPTQADFCYMRHALQALRRLCLCQCVHVSSHAKCVSV